MDLLIKLFSETAKFSGLSAIASYGGLLVTYYGYKALGWSFLVGLNHAFAWMIGTAMMVGLAAAIIVLVFKISVWIKGLFGASD